MDHEAKRIAIETGMSFEAARRIARRLGYEKGVKLAAYCLAANVDPDRLLPLCK